MAISINPVTVPQQTASKLWVLNITIQAPDPSKPVNAIVTVCPITDSGTLVLEQKKQFAIVDILAAAQNDATLANAINAIYAAIQAQVTAKNLYRSS